MDSLQVKTTSLLESRADLRAARRRKRGLDGGQPGLSLCTAFPQRWRSRSRSPQPHVHKLLVDYAVALQGSGIIAKGFWPCNQNFRTKGHWRAWARSWYRGSAAGGQIEMKRTHQPKK